MIPIRWQLYLVLIAAFVAGVFGIRAKLLAEGAARLQAKIDKDQLDAALRAKEIENEVEALRPDALRERAHHWVRDNAQ